MKGDANQGPDGGLVPARAIVGAADQYIPFAGYALAFLSTFTGLIAALSVLGALLVAYLFLEMLEPTRGAVLVQARKSGGP